MERLLQALEDDDQLQQFWLSAYVVDINQNDKRIRGEQITIYFNPYTVKKNNRLHCTSSLPP
jgi:hypothetical protein